MHVAAVETALPPNRYDQETLRDAVSAYLGESEGQCRRIAQMHQRVGVGARHLALPVDDYRALEGFDGANAKWLECAATLGERAILGALAAVDLRPTDIDALFFTTVTGLSVPSLDAHLIDRLGFRDDVKRVPLFGLGCLGGAAGIARMHDYLRAWPNHVAVLLAVELCSLTFQRHDGSMANMIASALFGDGAAAVVGIGSERASALVRRNSMSPTVRCTKSITFPKSHHVMGWEIGAHGFRVVLSADLPEIVEHRLAPAISAFLEAHELSIADVVTWVCHPGGPRVLETFEAAMHLPRSKLLLSWQQLERIGNISSASVLFVLQETLARHRQSPGSPGLLLAMGPGFSAELVLFEW